MSRRLVKRRILAILVCSCLLLIGIVFRLGWLQFVKGAELQARAGEQWLMNLPVEPKRGVIYDRNGNKLAISASAASVTAVPAEIEDPDETAKRLAEILEMDEEVIKERITSRANLVWVARQISDDKARQIRELDLEGIGFTEGSKRYYPKGNLASHVLGFVGVDNQGLDGIELVYDEYLRGKPGRIAYETDARNMEIPGGFQRYIPPEDGYDLYLTIDENIQHIVERELEKCVQLHQPKSATAIVMDPKTGAILALANKPDYDPNSWSDYPMSIWRNHAVSDVFEPGSTFKVVTMAAGLEEGVVSPSDGFFCPGFIKVAGQTIHCHRRSGHGPLTYAQVVYKSCNPGFANLGVNLLGKERLFKYIYGFAFDRKTGIDLPGEAIGVLFDYDRAGPVEVATTAFGQGPAVSAIQQITAFAGVVNDGKMMQPHVMDRITDKTGNVIKEFKPTQIRQIISPATSRTMRELLQGVVEQGTAKQARIEGYVVGGKTGTAQKPAPGGGYLKSEHIASFIGFGPVDDPQLVMMVTFDAPKGSYYGGVVAAPVFRQVMWDALRYLNVPLKTTEGTELEINTVPDVLEMAPDDAKNALRDTGFNVEQAGDGDVVVEQIPSPGAEVPKGTSVVIYVSRQPFAEDEVTIPPLVGKSMLDAGRIIGDLGLKMDAHGSGNVRRQWPPPGAKVRAGSVVTLELAPPSGGESAGG